MVNWNQAICDLCWHDKYPGRQPVRLLPEYRRVEKCAYCGKPNRSGTYVRDDPKAVRFPTPMDED
jgi:hypothetical protein